MIGQHLKNNTTTSKRNYVYWAESILIYSVVIFAFVFLSFYYKEMMPYKQGDTAFLVEVLSNISNGSRAISQILTQNDIEIKLARANLDIYCDQANIATKQFFDPYNVLTLHAYTILFLVAPITHLIGALNTLSVLTALSFISVPLIAYIYLRRHKASILIVLLATLVCISHPAWQISGIGQFYVDRLFIPFALLYTLLLENYLTAKQGGGNSLMLLMITIFAGFMGGLTSERNMLVVGLFTASYMLISRTQWRKKIFLAAFSLTCFTYVLLYMHFLGGTPDNTQVQGALINLPTIVRAVTRAGVGEYLLFNLTLLVLPAIFVPRIFFSVLPLILINCLITVGGAEKNGWATHYHCHYYGFLIASFLIAVAKINDSFHEKLSGFINKFLSPILGCIILLFWIATEHFYGGQGVFLSLWDYYGRPEVLSASRTEKSMFDKIAAKVPPGVTVTTTEWGMTVWYLRGNTVNVFPVGVGLNDYVMVQVEGKMPNLNILSAVRYKPDAKLANACISSVIIKEYKEVLRQGTWALFKKST